MGLRSYVNARITLYNDNGSVETIIRQISSGTGGFSVKHPNKVIARDLLSRFSDVISPAYTENKLCQMMAKCGRFELLLNDDIEDVSSHSAVLFAMGSNGPYVIEVTGIFSCRCIYTIDNIDSEEIAQNLYD